MVRSTTTASRSILHYDPDRIDYAVTESELLQLEEGGGTIWKDFFLASASVFLTSAPNAIGQFAGKGAFQFTAGLFLNSILAGISFVSALAFGLVWSRAGATRRVILAHIRNKPQVLLLSEALRGENSAEIGSVRVIALPPDSDGGLAGV